jgi:hypothetical protein
MAVEEEAVAVEAQESPLQNLDLERLALSHIVITIIIKK